MKSAVSTVDFNRSLSGIFTNPVFKGIVRTGDSDYLLGKLKKYDKQLSVNPGLQIKDVIETAYGYLSKNYRNEYLYKNTLLNNIFLGRHSVRTATMLNELKVAGSVADVVIINGTATVYEIKTELDSPDKVQKQIADYKKAFSKIYIVTHHSLSQKYLDLLEGTNVGLISLSGRFNLTELKVSIEDLSCLCIDTLFKMLRKEEYVYVTRCIAGYIPEVSNIRFFSECLKIARTIPAHVLYEYVVKQLKKRVPRESQLLESAELPRELKHICLCINPTKSEYETLFSFLNCNL